MSILLLWRHFDCVVLFVSALFCYSENTYSVVDDGRGEVVFA